MLQFVKNELTMARQLKQKVLMVSHIPLVYGADNRPGGILLEFVELVVSFADVIVAHFTGHTHNGSFA
jgi:hypothetical protein